MIGTTKVLPSTFSISILLVLHLTLSSPKQNSRATGRMGGSFTNGWLRGLSIDIINDAHGSVTPNIYAAIYDENSQSSRTNLFDGDDTTVWKAGSSSSWPSGDWVEYVAYEEFLLTDYQVVWQGQSTGCPTAWSLWGNDPYSGSWNLLHTVDTKRRQAAAREYLNMTVDNPGITQGTAGN